MACLAGILLFAFHTPPVQALVLDQILAVLEERLGVEIRAGQLRYNLLFLSAEVGNVSLANAATPDRPFALADSVGFRFGPGLFLGELDLRQVTLNRPRVDIAEGGAGSGSLTTGTTGGTGSIPELDIRNLNVTVDLGAIRMAMRDVSATLVRRSASVLDGHLVAAAGATVHGAGTVVDIASAEASVSLDGDILVVERLEAQGPGTTLSAKGTLGIAGANENVEFDVTGTVDVDSWLPASGPDLVAGTVKVGARVTGTRAEPAVALRVEGPNLRS